MKEIINSDEVDLVSFSEDNKEIPKKRKAHYVDNKELYASFVEFKKECVINEEKGLPRPTYPLIISKAMIAIANNYTYNKWFIKYSNSWKEEMIGDAIEICVRYAHNFKPDKSKNPYAYLTQLVKNAYYQRIDRERKQVYFRCKLFENHHGFSGHLDDNVDETQIANLSSDDNPIQRDYSNYIATYEEHRLKRKLKYAKAKKKKSKLRQFVEEKKS